MVRADIPYVSHIPISTMLFPNTAAVIDTQKMWDTICCLAWEFEDHDVVSFACANGAKGAADVAITRATWTLKDLPRIWNKIFYMAWENSSYDIAEFAVYNGADVNAEYTWILLPPHCEKPPMTALALHTLFGHTYIAQEARYRLLRMGANPNLAIPKHITRYRGVWTPLQCAAFLCDMSYCQLLCEHGARVDATTVDTPRTADELTVSTIIRVYLTERKAEATIHKKHAICRGCDEDVGQITKRMRVSLFA